MYKSSAFRLPGSVFLALMLTICRVGVSNPLTKDIDLEEISKTKKNTVVSDKCSSLSVSAFAKSTTNTVSLAFNITNLTSSSISVENPVPSIYFSIYKRDYRNNINPFTPELLSQGNSILTPLEMIVQYPYLNITINGQELAADQHTIMLEPAGLAVISICMKSAVNRTENKLTYVNFDSFTGRYRLTTRMSYTSAEWPTTCFFAFKGQLELGGLKQ